ncbi:MFS transporter, partial [Nonomuraea wenchangensis]
MPAAAPPSAPARHARQARAAVAVLFLTNGAVFFNVVPRYPQIKAELGVSNAVFGGAVAGYSIGALLAGLLAGVFVRRFGSARVAAFGIVITTLATLAIPFAPNWIAFGAALFVVGALDAVVDVAQNAHGLRVQRLYQRSILNSLHGVWSIGAVLGGLMGAAAAGLRLPLALHLGISAALFSVVAVVAYRFLLPGPEDAERTAPATAHPATADGHPATADGHPATADGHPVTADGHPATAGGDPVAPAGRRSFARPAVWMLAALGLLAACGAL